MNKSSNTGNAELKAFVSRLERLEADKDAVLADIAEVYAEVKAAGFTPKIVRKVVAERKKDPATREEENTLFDLYWNGVQGELFGETTVTAR